MPFDLFKKKKVLDFRPGREDIIIESKNQSSGSTNTSESVEPIPTPSGGGGFFGGFFSGDSSSSPSSSSSSSYSSSSSNNSSLVDADKMIRIERRVEDIADRLSKLLDRVDLLEKKMDRVERKGI